MRHNLRECHLLTGDADFPLKIVARGRDEYQAFLAEDLLALPNVAAAKSFLTLNTFKEEPGVPIT